ncbi:MAG TPA: response regulator transcription factor [Gammaproteobacteria bacterium]|nr:response regulator transcription factor [Gammaproteobacteria bacterium]
MAQGEILLVEDDPEIGKLVALELRECGYRVDWIVDGQAALERFGDDGFDLVILDLMLPSLGGIEVCRRIRKTDQLTPVLMLTAKADKRDVVHGLEAGGDDYLTKPFHTAELIARVQALLRRTAAVPGRKGRAESEANILHRGSLTIDPYKHSVTIRGRAVALTAKEFDLLLLFCRHPGRAYKRGELLNAVWGPEFDGYDHTVNTHINRLRNKIEDDAAEPRFIQTVWGVGYRFAQLDELIASEP